MFPNEHYWKINREERFYCGLLAHALLGSPVFRKQFADYVTERLQIRLAEPLEVYLEAAALRDYWNAIGDPRRYTQETHDKRRALLLAILRELEFEETVLDEHDFFWTSPSRRKLWNPGHWSESALQYSPLEKLLEVKWAFNAKPDLLLVCSGQALVIEAKLESGEGKNADNGYEQVRVQQLISRLLKLLVPVWHDIPFRNTMLTAGKSELQWSEIAAMVEANSDLDEFTKRCFRELRARYYDQVI